MTDSGRGGTKPAPPGAGIGLQECRRAARLLYGARQSLDRGRDGDEGYRVRLTLPVERA